MKWTQILYSLVSFISRNRGAEMEWSSISSVKEREKEGRKPRGERLVPKKERIVTTLDPMASCGSSIDGP